MLILTVWRRSHSFRRYFYVFWFGFMLGSALFLMSHNVIYAVQLQRSERYYNLYLRSTTLGPLRNQLPFTGTPGPWLTPAPKLTIQNTEFTNLKSGIPKVIHQTWENNTIPAQFKEWIFSWEKNLGDWTYIFWTANAAKQFIRKNFRPYKELYDAYPLKLQKADARRYFIMYHFGGVYADLDVESLRPLDVILSEYPCILSQEPTIHRVLLYEEEWPYIPMPGFMACRPKHPFFKLVMELLKEYSETFNMDVHRSTGPKFLKDALDIYLEMYNSTAEEYIYLAPPQWFLPTYDPMHETSFKIICTKRYDDLKPYKQRVCDELIAQNFTNSREGFPYTDHHWVHTASTHFRSNGTISIQDVLNIADVV